MKAFFSFFGLLVSLHSFCQYDNIKPQGIYSSNFIIDGKPRNIIYYMPATYGKQEVYPLLIVFHAEKSDAAMVIKKYGDIIQAKADSAGCIVLYPDAYKGHWNSNLKDTVNDVGFISIMSEFFLRQFDCDLSEIRLLGIGNGGNLCYRINCESIYQPNAIATINATANTKSFFDCRNKSAAVSLNISVETIAKADVEQAVNHLFVHKH